MRLGFNLIEAAQSLFDEEGIELPDIDEARRQAIKAAKAIMAAQIDEGHLDLSSRIDVTDESGEVVLSVLFSDVVTIGNC